MTELLFTTYYAITLPDGESANQVSSDGPISNADGSSAIYRSFRTGYQEGWLKQDPNFTISFKTANFQVSTNTTFDEEFILIDNKNDQTHFFRAFYGTAGTGQVSSDGLQRYELIGSPVDSVSHATILFKTQASGRKVRTVNIYGKKKEAEPAPEPATSNNTSANLLRALVGN